MSPRDLSCRVSNRGIDMWLSCMDRYSPSDFIVISNSAMAIPISPAME